MRGENWADGSQEMQSLSHTAGVELFVQFLFTKVVTIDVIYHGRQDLLDNFTHRDIAAGISITKRYDQTAVDDAAGL